MDIEFTLDNVWKSLEDKPRSIAQLSNLFRASKEEILESVNDLICMRRVERLAKPKENNTAFKYKAIVIQNVAAPRTITIATPKMGANFEKQYKGFPQHVMERLHIRDRHFTVGDANTSGYIDFSNFSGA